MKVTGEKVEEATGSTTTTAAEPTAQAQVVETTPKVSVEPELPDRNANERLVGRGTSSAQRRKNTPPVLVRLNRRKRQAHIEGRERREQVEDARDGNAALLEREKVKREQFERFATGQFVGGIVEGWGQRRRQMRNADEEHIESNYDEFQYHDDKVRYENEVLRENEAQTEKADRDHADEEAASERREQQQVEIRGAEDRWHEQRQIEQQLIEERVQRERESLSSRSESRDRSRGSDYERTDEYRDELVYHEHNRGYSNRRDD